MAHLCGHELASRNYLVTFVHESEPSFACGISPMAHVAYASTHKFDAMAQVSFPGSFL
jgi:hypothetical protein